MPRNFKPETLKKRALKHLIKYLQRPDVEVKHVDIQNHYHTIGGTGYSTSHFDTGRRTLTLNIFQKPKRKYKKRAKDVF